jgi:hypothetical protein
MEFDLTTKGTRQALDYIDSVIVKGIDKCSIDRVLSLTEHENPIVRHGVVVAITDYSGQPEVQQYLKKLSRDDNCLVDANYART